jgi:hypothetical protein
MTAPSYRRRRESGALLLMVALLLAIMAALAFGVNRAAGMDTAAVSSEYERRSTGYLLEATMAATKWTNEVVSKCARADLPSTNFAGALLSAKVMKAPSQRINVVATVTRPSGAVATLSRNEIGVVDYNKIDTRDLGGTALDTYVDPSLLAPMNNAATLMVSAQSNALLFWPAGEVSKDSEVLSAQLILTQSGTASPNSTTVTVHRVSTQWDANATWTTPRPGVAWKGGDFAAPIVASAKVYGAGTATWDVTGLVDGWASGRLANYGMLLRLPSPDPTATFNSLAATANLRPILRVRFANPC